MKKRRREKWYSAALRSLQGVELRYRNTSIGGTYVLEAVWEHYPVPVAQMWHRWNNKKEISILGCYTMSYYQRHGLNTRLLMRLINDYPKAARIVTEGSTPQSEGWLRKCGFVQNETDGWLLLVPGRQPKPEPIKKKRGKRKAK